MTTKISHEQSKSNVILTELVIVILFFALTAATAMQLFVGSHLKSRHNARVQEAIILCQDWVEQLQGQRDMGAFLESNAFVPAGDGVYTLGHGHLTLRAEVGQENTAVGKLNFCNLSATEANKDAAQPLFELPVAAYAPDEEVAG